MEDKVGNNLYNDFIFINYDYMYFKKSLQYLCNVFFFFLLSI